MSPKQRKARDEAREQASRALGRNAPWLGRGAPSEAARREYRRILRSVERDRRRADRWVIRQAHRVGAHLVRNRARGYLPPVLAWSRDRVLRATGREPEPGMDVIGTIYAAARLGVHRDAGTLRGLARAIDVLVSRARKSRGYYQAYDRANAAADKRRQREEREKFESRRVVFDSSERPPQIQRSGARAAVLAIAALVAGAGVPRSRA